MILNTKTFFITFFSCSLVLSGCSWHDEKQKLTRVKLISTVKQSAWWHCGNDGYTIIELPTNERRIVCGQYGNNNKVAMLALSAM